jgi:methionyl-tRNA formyltransferase
VALRIIFCGTPEFALPALRALVAAPDISAHAYNPPPARPRGRGQEMATSPVKEFAIGAGLHVFQPEKIRSVSARDFITNVAPDAIVIIAYGQIIPGVLLDIPRLGWINVHASLLPRYRGAAPIQWAIVNGETRTGVTTMRIDAGLDTGPILEKVEIEIGPDENAPELSKRLAEAGGGLIINTLRKLDRGEIQSQPQDGSQATHARPLKKEDGRVDWNLSAQAIYNRIRGLEPWPGAYTKFRGQICQLWGRPEEREKTLETPGTISISASKVFVACGEGSSLRLEALKLEGRKRIGARDFVNGAHLKPGEKLGD